LADAVADVLRDAPCDGLPGGGANFFFYGFEAAHFDSCGALGFVRGEATADFFFGGGLLEGEELFIHVAASLLFVEEGFDTADEIVEGHGGSLIVEISGFEDAGDGGELASPLLGLFLESFAAAVGEEVVLGAAIVFAGSPLRLDAGGALEAGEGGEEGAGVDAEDAVADLLDAQGDTVAVHGLEGEGFEDEHFEGSLDEVAGLVGHGAFPLDGLEVQEVPLDCQEERVFDRGLGTPDGGIWGDSLLDSDFINET